MIITRHHQRLVLLGLFSALLALPSAAQAQPVGSDETLDLGARVTAELTRLVGTDGTLPESSYGVWEQDTEAADGPTVAFADPLLLGDAAEGLITRPSTLANDLPKLLALTGASAQHVALVVHPKTAALPGMDARLDLLATGAGLERVSMWAATSGEDLITDLVERKDGFDVLYLDAGLGLPDADLAKLADIAMARKVPVFTAEAQRVADGFLASATPDFLDGLARRVALCLHDDATCPSSASLPAATPPPALTINAAIAAALGLTLPWATQLEAVLVGDAADAGATLTLDEAMRRAAEQNLAIEAERYALDRVEAQLRAAESALYPQLGASTTARVINEDLANAALGGASPERLWTLDGTLEQLLFSNGAFGGISIQKKVAALQTLFFEEAKLGVAEEAGKAFLGVLRAQTGVAIARERIQRLTANLDAAQLRLDYGTTSPADVARLRAEAASARQDLARALGGAEATRIALNQTLNEPLDAAVTPVLSVSPASGASDDALSAPRTLLATIPVIPALTSPAATDALAERYTASAMMDAPIVQALTAAVDIQDTRVGIAERAYYLPDVVLFGSGTTRIVEGGAGLTLPPGLPIPLFPNETWAVGLTAQIDFFTGGRRKAEEAEARAARSAATVELQQIQQRLEQGVRTASALLATAYAAYTQAEIAAEAAASAYADVSRLYREGVVTVTDVVEAQEALRITEELTATAAYDVADAYLDLQRASGRFDALAAN